MLITLLIKGIIIGFGMAIPIGPIGIMCIRTTLTEGRIRGLIIGLGAATSDMFYGCIAAFGLTIISEPLLDNRMWIRLLGGALLLFLGLKTFMKKTLNPKIADKKGGMFGTYFYVIFLTLTNPLTIFAFLGVFAILNLDSNLNIFSAIALVVGVFFGSILWFVFLSSVVTIFRSKFNIVGLQWVNRIAGLLIIISGIYAIIGIM